MSAPRVRPVRLRVLGQLVPPLMSRGTAGALLGYARSHSYAVAERDNWPMDGGRVIGPAFCERFSLAYEVVLDDPHDEREE